MNLSLAEIEEKALQIRHLVNDPEDFHGRWDDLVVAALRSYEQGFLPGEDMSEAAGHLLDLRFEPTLRWWGCA